MRVRITKHVPGLTEGRFLVAGEEVTLSDGLAASLIQDGYAAVIGRAAPAERRETATAKRKES